MTALLDDPMVQAGLAPLAVALVVGAALALLRRPGLPWLAVPAALLTTLALTTGIGFTPLSASRKVLLLVLLAPLVGLMLDLSGLRHRALSALLAVGLGLSTAWVFHSVLVQAAVGPALLTAAGLGLFVGAMAALNLRLRDDGPAAAAATLGLGLAVGVCAVLSASIGTLMNGLAVAAAGGALLLLQWLRGVPLAAGWTGSLTTASAAGLFPAATFMLADLRWPAMVLLLLVPLAAAAPVAAGRGTRGRTVLLGLACGAAALAPIAAAWFSGGAAPG